MLSFVIRAVILLAIALVYAIYDLFNKRNVPDSFVYASAIIALLVTFTYSIGTIGISILIATVIGSIGYVLYRAGILGAGDFFEFMAISLIFPYQPAPLIVGIGQLNIPFILSIFIATGTFRQ